VGAKKNEPFFSKDFIEKKEPPQKERLI